jgi:hypothetical protein
MAPLLSGAGPDRRCFKGLSANKVVTLALWLARAAESHLVPLQRFAKGLRDDDDAVKAGLTWPWSHERGLRHLISCIMAC